MASRIVFNRRRSCLGYAKTVALNFALAFIGLLSFGWSQLAHATIGCEIQPNSTVTQTGPVNSTLTYSFDIVNLGGCGATVAGTIIPGADSTVGASATPLAWSAAPGSTVTITVTLGNTGGGTALFNVACSSDCFNGNTNIAWTAQTTSGSCNLASIAPAAQTGASGSTLNYQFGVAQSSQCDQAGGISGTITVSGPVVGSVLSQATFSHYTIAANPHPFSLTLGAGIGAETITIQCTQNCSTTGTLTYTATATAPSTYALTATNPASGSTTTNVATTIPLAVRLDNSSVPVPAASIAWTVVGPAATLGSATDATDGAGISDNTFNATVSGNYAVTATYCDAACVASGFPTATTTINIQVADTYTLTPNVATSYTVLSGTNVPLSVKYLVNGAASTQTTSWSVDNSNGFVGAPTSAPDGAGNAVNFFYSYTPGTYVVTVAGNCPTAVPNCPPTPVTFTVVVEDAALSIVTPPGGTATIADNTPITLQVKFSGPTLPIADGTQIDWVVASEPSSGAGSFSPSGSSPPAQVSTTTTNGLTSVSFSGATAGNYKINANYCPDGCDDQVTFTITVAPKSADLALTITDSPDPVQPGAALTYKIRLSNAGPDAATTVTMDDVLPASLAFTSLNTPPGWSCTTPAVGANGAVNCTRATFPATGLSVFTVVTQVSSTVLAGSTISNTATAGSSVGDPTPADASATATTSVAAEPASLAIGSGDNQSTPVNTVFPLPLTVVAQGTGPITLAASPGVTINWTVLSGSATLASATSVTNGSGIASMTVTAGPTPGPIVIRATRADDPSVQVNFSLTATLLRTLAISSGNNQSGTPNNALPLPLVVLATNNGSPASGVAVAWSILSGSGSLASASNSTNASGNASSVLTMGPTPGTVTVKAARVDDPTVFVTFTANSASLASLPGLTPAQLAVAQALDEFCPQIGGSSPPPSTGGFAAAATATPSSTGQADLAARCSDLLNAIGSDPDGVANALDQLFADLALVQSESSLLAAQAQFDNIKARIAALRSGTRGTSFGGLAIMGSGGQMPIGAMFQNLLDGDQPQTKEAGADFSRWGFFAAGTIGRGNADAGVVSPSYDFDINGLTVGADYRYSDKLIFGGTLGYTRQGNSLHGTEGNLDTSGWSISAYGTFYHADSWYSDAVLSYGRNSYDAERRVHYSFTLPGGSTTTIDQTGKSSSNGDSVSLAATVGRDFNRGGWGFGPYFRAIYTRLNFDPMTEVMTSGTPGSGLALEFDTRSVTSLSSTLGGKLTYAHSASWGVLIPHLQLEWQHEFQTDPSAVEARFLFDPTATPFTVTGDAVDTDFFRFGVGMSFVLTHGRSGFFYYEKLISRERFSQDSLAFGIRLEF